MVLAAIIKMVWLSSVYGIYLILLGHHYCMLFIIDLRALVKIYGPLLSNMLVTLGIKCDRLMEKRQRKLLLEVLVLSQLSYLSIIPLAVQLMFWMLDFEMAPKYPDGNLVHVLVFTLVICHMMQTIWP